ncbi:MAG: SPOR domain-containing protein [Gammaproteobacteria bacterium]|nr:SPOR domain-containing protein [Gammaproteobacteria bacterium]MCW8839998.1 SPOR domain-containing protein [Gammaproteobacteria bacterium]MCW8927970.1 SPOR domain-containing protein [Gammaproteobacteria bacterium]MCW8958255.1 SPOR domain-containing protein [Gammaproteobacteria bacterium]MCW8972187.1 SPOR domain-containing protein [Gammaproteobacteria bacterium]
MAQRDYAKRTTTRKAKKQVPGWLWMLAGLLVGLFIAFLVYLQQSGGAGALQQKLAGQKSAPAKTDARAVKKEPAAEAPKKQEGISFDFYNILPELEVVIPEDELKKETGRTEGKATYYLQVGSFKSAGDAEARKAQLFLLNFTPSVQTVTIDGNQTWHRVRIGPFSDARSVDRARRRLQDNDIDFIMLKDKS